MFGGAAFAGVSAYQILAGELMDRAPQANAVRISTFEEQVQYFETGGKEWDAFFDAAEEGAAWTVLYPLFAVAVPRPVVQLPTVYLVAPDRPALLRAMNEWLLIEKATGGIDEIYDYWVQGETGQIQPPRWSVIRDVLGWID